MKYRGNPARNAVFMALVSFSIPWATADQQIPLQVNGQKIMATLAVTIDQREMGLKNRRTLARNSAMLFVFPRTEYYSMWMKDTLIPLDVAFIGQNGNIINIEKMAPLSLDHHTAQKPAKYALEMNAGWFHRHSTNAGDIVQGLEVANSSGYKKAR